MKTVDFVKGMEWEILESYGFHRTDNRHIDCPLCQGKKKFRINERGGEPAWICVCGNGNMWNLLIEFTGKAFADIAKEIDERWGNSFDKVEKPKPKPAIDLSGIKQLEGSQAEAYLKSRGINVLPQKHIGLSVKEWHRESGQSYETMTAIATDYTFKAALVHRTYLKDGKKIEHETDKKLFKLRESQNIAVRMFDSDTTLGIAEGIESALSANQLYKVATWATLNTAFMKTFRAPRGVRNLIIFADNDKHGAGHAAAFECGHRNILSNNDVMKVIIKWPESGDFNDHLTDPKRVYEWILTK